MFLFHFSMQNHHTEVNFLTVHELIKQDNNTDVMQLNNIF
jgi:hypothetical protein